MRLTQTAKHDQYTPSSVCTSLQSPQGIATDKKGYPHNIFLFIPRHTIVAGYYGFTLVVPVSIRLSVRPSVRPSVRFSFPDDNLSKLQWVFTKFYMCIDIVEIWFGIANGQISSVFDGVICPRHAHIFLSGL